MFISYLRYSTKMIRSFMNRNTFVYLFIFLLNLYSLASFSGSVALTRIPKTVLIRRWREAFCLIFSSWRERIQFLAITYEVNYKSFVIFFIKMKIFCFISSFLIILQILGFINSFFFPEFFDIIIWSFFFKLIKWWITLTEFQCWINLEYQK